MSPLWSHSEHMVALVAESASLGLQTLRSELVNFCAVSMVPYCANMFRYRLIINQENTERGNTDAAFETSLTQF